MFQEYLPGHSRLAGSVPRPRYVERGQVAIAVDKAMISALVHVVVVTDDFAPVVDSPGRCCKSAGRIDGIEVALGFDEAVCAGLIREGADNLVAVVDAQRSGRVIAGRPGNAEVREVAWLPDES